MEAASKLVVLKPSTDPNYLRTLQVWEQSLRSDCCSSPLAVLSGAVCACSAIRSAD